MITKFGDGRDWFFEKRFGMFVHWGLYAIPAWHEQILWRGTMTRREYETLVQQFNPTTFDPNHWLDVMQRAGMEYICVTTKHHDGFCLWDTAHTDYNVMHTPYRRDVLAMIAEACAKRRVPLCLYYSLPDWHHPNYPNLGRHHEMFGPRPTDRPDPAAYLQFVRNQVEELCTKYGDIHAFFWDVNVGEFWDPTINDRIRRLQPQALINDRGPGPGDYSTPERHVPTGRAFTKPTEACQSLGRESWGYKSDEDYYSAKLLMQSIDRIMAMGGNYLLNVGPQADGSIAAENIATLTQIGAWYARVREAFDHTEPASTMVQPDYLENETIKQERDDVLVTRSGNTLYIHAYKDPQSTALILKPLRVQPLRATLLNTGRTLETRVDVTPWHWREPPYLRVRGLPVDTPSNEVMVIKLEFDASVAE